jgi:histidine ammonia-lyase
MRISVVGAVVAVSLAWAGAAFAQAPGYKTITPNPAARTVVLTGDDLTPEQVVQVARYGAKVEVSAAAKKRGSDTYNLMMEGAAEGMPVYLFNRGAGSGRETQLFVGSPLSAENRPVLEARALRQFQNGARGGAGPEVAEEEVTRAQMVVRINGLTYEAGSPQLLQGLVDLLNARITPVVQTRGGSGEADGPYNGNTNAALVGVGQVYMGGVRMPAAQALAAAGLKPITPGGGDTTVSTTNAWVTGQAALLVADGREALEWADLVYAVDLAAMNSSLTPLFAPVQVNRPFPWLNWQAKRVLDMLKGSYLFNDDPKRIIQDPESLRASAIRTGSAWQAWAHLNETVRIQLNHSDHNPVVKIGMDKGDAWELATPQAQKYFVKGGPLSNGQHGFIFSNANWDWYPVGNEVEAFTNALANLDVAVLLRNDRFTNTFFTVIRPAEVLSPEQIAGAPPTGQAKVMTDIWQDVQGWAVPVPASGLAIISTVEDLQGQTRLKVGRARAAVEATFQLLGHDLLTGAYWMDVRKAQDPTRTFGPGPTAVHAALRRVFPWNAPAAPDGAPNVTIQVTDFMRANPAAGFSPPAPPMPAH